jgi:hypothetical protein
MERPVDAAMAAERPEKQTIRGLWVDVVADIKTRFPGSKPLYLALSGAEGRDLELLAQRGVFARTETGAVAADDLQRLVAVESQQAAVIHLLNKFPGLTVRQQPVQDLVRNVSPTAWPEGEDIQICRARVINLDLNAPLAAANDAGQVVFPLLTCVSKFSQLHAITPPLDWVLFLTLHAELSWPREACQTVVEFLAENCAEEPEFAAGCRALLGEALYASTIGARTLRLDVLDREAQQKVLMAFVPKRISQAAIGQGWRVVTTRGLRYGGTEETAPMVAWVIEFRWDPRTSGTPRAVYRESLRSVFVGGGRISEDGTISP